jgi:hypothetical protein
MHMRMSPANGCGLISLCCTNKTNACARVFDHLALCVSAGSSSQEAAAHSIRQPRQRSLAAAPKASSSSSSRALGGEGICQGNRLVANSSNLSTSDSISAGSGPPSCSSSASNSRRGSGDKPHVPIWERSLPSGPAESRKAAAAAAGPKLLQAVALKTFSPTLGSMGALSLTQGVKSSLRVTWPGMTCCAAPSM